MRRLVWLAFAVPVLALTAPADDPPRKAGGLNTDRQPLVKLSPGDALVVAPNVPPAPGMGVPLSPNPEHAERAGRLFKGTAADRRAMLKDCDGKTAHFLRASNKLKVTTFRGGDKPVEVEVESGPAKGKTGWVHPDFVYTKFLPPKDPPDPKKYPEARRKELFARYFLMLRVALTDARKTADPDMDRPRYEDAAGELFVRRLDKAIKEEGVTQEDWFKIVLTGLADGWDPNEKPAEK